MGHDIRQCSVRQPNGLPVIWLEEEADLQAQDKESQNWMMVQGAGFEPAKHYALGPKPSPFDHSGTPA